MNPCREKAASNAKADESTKAVLAREGVLQIAAVANSLVH